MRHRAVGAALNARQIEELPELRKDAAQYDWDTDT